jgi:hypothetical protein
MDSLSLDIYYRIDCKGTARELWEAMNRLYGDSSTSDDGKLKMEDDHKEKVHECCRRVKIVASMSFELVLEYGVSSGSGGLKNTRIT